MSLQDVTLHDFVLNLLTDDAARSAFAADPTAVLSDAGLGDVTAQDVQEVLPLVADQAGLPVTDLLGALPTDGVEDAVQTLEFFAHQVTGQVAPFLGDFTSATQFEDGAFANSFGFANEFLTGASAIAADGTEFAASQGLVTDLGTLGVATAGGTDGLAGSLGFSNETVVAQGAAAAGLGGIAASGGVGTDAAGVGLAAAGGLDGISGSTDVETFLGDADGALAVSTDGAAVGGGLETPVGDLGLQVGADLSGNPADALSLSVDSPLGSFGLDGLDDITSSLPVDLPELPSELPTELPTDLPIDLPVANELPGLDQVTGVVGNVTGVVQDSPLGGIVDSTPVGDLAPQVGNLPVVGDLTDGLGL
ncbi:IniB N-terminal domain-containing protein [Amycolatopsis magusensis]|uniref:IniB N-terminal domain-containing protein n=1 Tax=Amycolatopsis magusensis TaxID=882444 RepID=UPI003C2F73FA